MLEIINDLMRKKDFCVLATVGDGRPHCSLMGFAADDDRRRIYMATLADTQKWRNLSSNPQASLLIDSRDEAGDRAAAAALTVSGRHEPLSASEAPAVLDRLRARLPHLAAFLSLPALEIINIRVKSLLLLQGPTDAYYHEVRNGGEASGKTVTSSPKNTVKKTLDDGGVSA